MKKLPHESWNWRSYGAFDILVVVVRRLSRRWKMKTLLAGPSPTSPMRRRLPTPLFPTLPFGNRSLHGLKFEASKLPFLKLSSSPGSYMEQYHMELIRLLHSPTKVSRLPSSRGLSTGGYAFVYRLPSPEAHPRFPTSIYRLPSPEAYPRLATKVTNSPISNNEEAVFDGTSR